ncbi:MAG: HupE/UreJ family protein [Deltaproteobacteria bacterium]|nr:HupE/UreJ family protein [Deltaproteobacteria bacterium]MBI3388257.1 HupE/UreJ family protein [Deltaproteobacteria bacterium]
MTTPRRSLIVPHVIRCMFLILVFFSAPAAAHDRTTSYSGWVIRGREAEVALRLSQLDLSHYPWGGDGTNLEAAAGTYAIAHLKLSAGDAPCAVVDGPRPLSAAPGRVVIEWRVRCPEQGGLRVRSDLLFDVASGHLHFARVTRDGAEPLERVLSEGEREWSLDEPAVSTATAPEPGGTTLLEYVELGIGHILTGYDHLAFLLALLLIGGTFGEVAKVVTGFTVAHSITLALTALGYVRPETAPVEALIGLSIALVAVENVWLTGPRTAAVPLMIAAMLTLLAVAAVRGYGRVPALTLVGLALFVACYFGLLARVSNAASLRWAIAFIFGLVHGFGFASVLVEAGLPTERLVQALFGFNVGVEVGQLAAVALVWPLLRLIARRSESRRMAVSQYGSAAVLALGVFWFVSRAFG